jgi:hypothetical protein
MINEEQNPEVKKQYINSYNKYKRQREGNEDVGDWKVYKRRSVPEYLQYGCEFLGNDKSL